MISDNEYGYSVGDIVYVPYMTDVPAGFYEVSAINPLWIVDDDKGSFNSQNNDISGIKLICKNLNREET